MILSQPKGGLPGVAEGLLLRALKGVYGIVDAARQWWLKLRSVLLGAGYRQSAHEPGLFYMHEKAPKNMLYTHDGAPNAAKGQLISAVCTHVDGWLFCFAPGKAAKQLRSALRAWAGLQVSRARSRPSQARRGASPPRARVRGGIWRTNCRT